jgi:hypothetical protein
LDEAFIDHSKIEGDVDSKGGGRREEGGGGERFAIR